MSFEELWREVEKLKMLPDTAIAQIPDALTVSTKEKLLERMPKDVAEIVTAAIDEVNRGSVDLLDDLIKKRL